MQSRYLHLQIHFLQYAGQQRQKLHQHLPEKINDILKKLEYTHIIQVEDSHQRGPGLIPGSAHEWDFLLFFVSPLLSSLYHCSKPICHCPLRCAIALTRQHSITSSVFKLGASSLSLGIWLVSQEVSKTVF
jgi:hypothetical protein